MRIDTTKNSVEKLWNESVIPALSEYIKSIPNPFL